MLILVKTVAGAAGLGEPGRVGERITIGTGLKNVIPAKAGMTVHTLTVIR
jgi:hypothetical protein